MLEALRLQHEELEALEGGLTDLLSSRPRSLRGALLCDLGCAALLRAAQALSARLATAQEDHAGLLRAEMALLTGSSSSSDGSGLASGDAALQLFYARLADAAGICIAPSRAQRGLHAGHAQRAQQRGGKGLARKERGSGALVRWRPAPRVQ